MAIGAYKCVDRECKGFVVFDDADFNFNNIPVVNGMYEFDSPCCSECDKEYKVVPHYSVILLDEDCDFEEADSACITAYERREKERKFENETSAYEKVKLFIQLQGYSYSVDAVIEGYLARQRQEYISYTMKDCVNNLEQELKYLTSI